MLRWGIFGTGNIARQFACGLKVSRTGRLAAVGSRSLASAQSFCDELGGMPYGSYADVLASAEVDVIYIATPHHLHLEHTRMVAAAGKGILCEKPFTLSNAQAVEAMAAVRDANVFFMEAFMYRCHPQTRKIQEIITSGKLGDVRQIHSEFGFRSTPNWKNFRMDASLGGGALMDVGTYCVSFSRMVAQFEPESAHYVAHCGAAGYDEAGTGILRFPGGITASFGTAIHVQLQNGAVVYGTEGCLTVDWPWKCAKGAVRVWQGGAVVEQYELGTSNDELYASEADAVAEFFNAGECPYVTHADTLGQAIALDRLRESAGLFRLG